MKLEKTEIEGLVIVTPKIFEDERGFLFESFNKEKFRELGLEEDYHQDVISCSKKGVIRGLHLQRKPHEIAKLVSVSNGSILDIAVDLRKNSPTYKKQFSIILSNENKKMLFVPKGFLHGFLSLEENTIVSYKFSGPFNKEFDFGVNYLDEDLKINWDMEKFGIDNPIISEKDKNLPFLKDVINQLD